MYLLLIYIYNLNTKLKKLKNNKERLFQGSFDPSYPWKLWERAFAPSLKK